MKKYVLFGLLSGVLAFAIAPKTTTHPALCPECGPVPTCPINNPSCGID